ncbi:MAG: GspE/PulE family protein [Candidatus Methanomethyliaceae archaeon]
MNLEFLKFAKEKLVNKIENIEEIIQEAQANNISLEEYLYILGKLPEEFLEIKKDFYQLPFKRFYKNEKIPKEVLTLINEDYAKKYKIIAFDRKPDGVYLGIVNPDIENFNEVINFLKNSLNSEVKIYLISIKDFYGAIKQYHEFTETLKNIVYQLREKAPPPIEKPIELGEEMLPSEEAPIIKLVQALIEEAVYNQASDIHIEPLSRKTRIRYRLLGELRTIAYLPKDFHEQIVNRIKVLARLRLDETRIPQDGRIKAIVQGREIDLRIGTLPTAEGEKVAIRILDPLIGLKRIEELGMFDYTFEKVEIGIKNPYGLILITGPTGSGKTTTLYSILQRLNKENVNIISLEDPVEYRIEGINQSQVRPEIGYSFATGLREILRQDPDIILVGEIRDLETAELAIHASLTGHLVLSTLHTNTAIGAITRLIDLGIERFLLPPTIKLIIAQRLVKKLCDNCKKEIEPPDEIKKVIKEEINKIDEKIKERYIPKEIKIFHPNGCEKCDYKGYMGRIGIFEVILATEEIQNAIYEGKSELEIEELLKNQSFVNLRGDGIIKALNGLTTIEEVIKIT